MFKDAKVRGLPHDERLVRGETLWPAKTLEEAEEQDLADVAFQVRGHVAGEPDIAVEIRAFRELGIAGSPEKPVHVGQRRARRDFVEREGRQSEDGRVSGVASGGSPATRWPSVVARRP